MYTIHTTNDRAAWLKGPGHRCSHLPAEHRRTWRLALLGPPGVGKGTQAHLLCERLHTCHLSTGDIFRMTGTQEADEASPAMSVAKEFMQQGKLVPDSTVVALVKERRTCLSCCGGFLLDGFPRTEAQAAALEGLMREERVSLDAVIFYHAPLDVILNRITGRRTCPKCKAVYHLSNCPPKMGGICDQCSVRLVERADDSEESVRTRMTAYNRTTAPLLEYFANRNLLLRVSAAGTPAQVLTQTMTALNPQNLL